MNITRKKKIKTLFKEYYNNETMPVIELEDKVLALFDVVGQSEQLVCEWYEKQINKGVLCDDCNEE